MSSPYRERVLRYTVLEGWWFSIGTVQLFFFFYCKFVVANYGRLR